MSAFLGRYAGCGNENAGLINLALVPPRTEVAEVDRTIGWFVAMELGFRHEMYGEVGIS